MNHVYAFSYETGFEETEGFPSQTSSNKRFVVSDAEAWPVVMREFANFMSGIYGYNITERLKIEEWDGEHIKLCDYE